MPMSTAHAATAQQHARSTYWVLLNYIFLGIVALLPRVLDLGTFLTGDEANFWLHRSVAFWNALKRGDFAATAISTHPGVTTMWLGGMGLRLQDFLLSNEIVRDGSYAAFIGMVRLPVAITHTLGVLFGYALLRKLLPALPAFLAAFCWASDPFMIAFSRVLHVDALAGTFMTLSILAACYYWHHTPRTRWLIISGVCAALGILSKSPALIMGLIVALIALAALRNPPDDLPPLARGRWFIAGDRWLVLSLAVWGIAMLATVVLLWPTLWTGPSSAIALLRLGIEAEGAEPHMLGNFFLGRADDAPGLLFYPVAVALRLTPWTLIGVLALPLAYQRARAANRRDLAAFALLVVLFVVAMSIFPKKFNRYLIPIFPTLDILAAVGLAALFDAVQNALTRLRSATALAYLRSGLVALVLVAACINVAWWHPYSIAAFNQLLGGARAGERAFLTGWGEGYSLVAAWLNEQPDITGVVTVSAMNSSIQPYMRRGAQVRGPQDGGLPNKAGYIVVYIRQVQDGSTVPPFSDFYGKHVPLHTVTIHGIDYAWIYQVPPVLDVPRQATFGPSIELLGYDQSNDFAPGQTTTLTFAWRTREAQPSDLFMFAHLIGPDQQRYSSLDIPLAVSEWQPGRVIRNELPISLPADAPAGVYRLTIGLYNLADGARLPVQSPEPINPELDGPEALLLAEFVLE